VQAIAETPEYGGDPKVVGIPWGPGDCCSIVKVRTGAVAVGTVFPITMESPGVSWILNANGILPVGLDSRPKSKKLKLAVNRSSSIPGGAPAVVTLAAVKWLPPSKHGRPAKIDFDE